LASDEPPDPRIGGREAERMAEVLRQRAALLRPNGPLDGSPGNGERLREARWETGADCRPGLERRARDPCGQRPPGERRVGPGTAVGCEAERGEAPSGRGGTHRRGVKELSRSDTSSS